MILHRIFSNIKQNCTYSKVTELNLDIRDIERYIAQKSLFFNKYKICERSKINRDYNEEQNVYCNVSV